MFKISLKIGLVLLSVVCLWSNSQAQQNPDLALTQV